MKKFKLQNAPDFEGGAEDEAELYGSVRGFITFETKCGSASLEAEINRSGESAEISSVELKIYSNGAVAYRESDPHHPDMPGGLLYPPTVMHLLPPRDEFKAIFDSMKLIIDNTNSYE